MGRPTSQKHYFVQIGLHHVGDWSMRRMLLLFDCAFGGTADIRSCVRCNPDLSEHHALAFGSGPLGLLRAAIRHIPYVRSGALPWHSLLTLLQASWARRALRRTTLDGAVPAGRQVLYTQYPLRRLPLLFGGNGCRFVYPASFFKAFNLWRASMT